MLHGMQPPSVQRAEVMTGAGVYLPSVLARLTRRCPAGHGVRTARPKRGERGSNSCPVVSVGLNADCGYAVSSVQHRRMYP
jgi:hypothetical protein